MLSMMNRTTLILSMFKCNIDLKYIKNYSLEQLLHICTKLEGKDIPSHWYSRHDNILSELIYNEAFIDWLAILAKAGVFEFPLDALVGTIQANGESVTDYSTDRIISTLKLESLNHDTHYDFLKYFSHQPLNEDQHRLIAENLKIFYKKNSIRFSKLSEAERAIISEPFISCSCLFPTNSPIRACELMASDASLLEIMRNLYESNIEVAMGLEEYEEIHKNSSLIKEGLLSAFRLFGNDDKIITNFVERWMENKCPIYDLDILEKRLLPLTMDERQVAVESRSSYINLLYGSKINGIPLADIRGHHEDILIYSITNRKNRFLKLIEESYDFFENMSKLSILFKREFYAKLINLNTLTAKDLKDCARMTDRYWSLDDLEHETYTFAEIKALYGLSQQYIQLYDKLTVQRVDDRLIILKQLTKRNLLAEDLDENDISKLAEKLSVKPLYTWMKEDFSHIGELKAPEVIQLLLVYDELVGLIPQMKTPSDVILAIRVKDSIYGYDDLKSLKNNMAKIDPSWSSLVRAMGFSDEFLQENAENIVRFICRNGAQIALTYYHQLSNGKREAFNRIVKAELMGRFDSLKYFEDDLRREISYPVNDTLKSTWAQNLEAAKGSVYVKECDDFFSTMLLGTMPQRTCLSYIDGAHNNCLLSGFDTNKKLLYAYEDGKVVGRAIIRLTKGRYSNPGESFDGENEASLSFVDVENIDATSTGVQKIHPTKEYLVLFLERPYVAGVSPAISAQIHSQFIELMEEKASLMGGTLVLSSDYNCSKRPGYVHTSFNLYISQSKAGAQYLDSLSGSAHVADERSYRSNNFMIRQQDICD